MKYGEKRKYRWLPGKVTLTSDIWLNNVLITLTKLKN